MAGLQYLKFGNKASFAATSRECFVVGALGFHGNPYDGRTPAKQLEQTARLCGRKAYGGDVFVDLGHRGHGYAGAARIHICGRGVKRAESDKRLSACLKNCGEKAKCSPHMRG